MGPIYGVLGPGTLKTEENAEAACTVASRTSTRPIDSGIKMEHWSVFLFLFWNLLLRIVCFVLVFYLGASWERASELFPL